MIRSSMTQGELHVAACSQCSGLITPGNPTSARCTTKGNASGTSKGRLQKHDACHKHIDSEVQTVQYPMCVWVKILNLVIAQ